MVVYLPRFQFAHHPTAETLRDTGGGTLCDIILLRIVLVLSAPAVEGFGDNPAGVIVFIRHRGVSVFHFHQTAQIVIAEGGVAERAVTVAVRHFFIRHLVGDVIAVVEVRTVREGSSDAAACGIILIAQRTPGKIGFGDKLSGFVLFQTVVLTFGIDDFGQVGEFIVAAFQLFAIRAYFSYQ